MVFTLSSLREPWWSFPPPGSPTRQVDPVLTGASGLGSGDLNGGFLHQALLFATYCGMQRLPLVAETATKLASGICKRQRPELFRLLSDAQPGDVLLVEQVDRLSRLTEADWQKLRAIIRDKEVRVVSLDLPTLHQFMVQANGSADTFTSRMLGAINDMLQDMLAAVARKDYEDRLRRQRDGIQKAKERRDYKGDSYDLQKAQRIQECLAKGMGIEETSRITGTSTATTQVVKKRLQASHSQQ